MSDVRVLFDPDRESLYCGRCGQKCEPLGHLMSIFLLCPTHGEFTIAPVVMRNTRNAFHPEGDNKWYMHCDATVQGMWETCRHLDALPDLPTGAARA